MLAGNSGRNLPSSSRLYSAGEPVLDCPFVQGEAFVLNPPPTHAVSRKRLSASEPAERSSAVKKFKSAPLSQVKGRQLTRRVDDVWGHVQKSARKEDALAVLSKKALL